MHPPGEGALAARPSGCRTGSGDRSCPGSARWASVRGRAARGRLATSPTPRYSLRPRPQPPALLTETPYLSAMPCSVSPGRTRCSTWRSMTPAPSGARTLAVLPYERVLVRARLSDSSASSASESERDGGGGEGAEGRGVRGPAARRDRSGEESAMGPAEAARSGSSPRGRRLVRRRLLFLLTGAAEGRSAGTAGWRPRRKAADRPWWAPAPTRSAFPSAPEGRKAKRAPAAASPMPRLHPARRDPAGPAVRGAGRAKAPRRGATGPHP